MGDHYLPRYYLRGFTLEPGGQIWAYDKARLRKFRTAVKNVAMETGFYSREVEQLLANSVENPANQVLDKIRRFASLTSGDKDLLAPYIAAMMTRVPRHRLRMNETAPPVASRLYEEIAHELDLVALADPGLARLAAKRKLEAKEILDRYCDHPPKEVWLRNIPPASMPNLVASISSMKWCYLTYEQPAFLTCDNPVFFFTWLGVSRPQSEISFPLSSRVALWGRRGEGIREEFLRAKRQAVYEVNRRTAANTTRFAFHCKDEDWILPFLGKGDWALHHMLLTGIPGSLHSSLACPAVLVAKLRLRSGERAARAAEGPRRAWAEPFGFALGERRRERLRRCASIAGHHTRSSDD
ncbi:MAG: DUF4238 domain-containing protein [Planctomycetes bacterium]|nr:DUF4238 domain-containing protein [Planctomycetota bacterium]